MGVYMAEHCPVCKAKFGGMMGAKYADIMHVELAKKLGVDVPGGICQACFMPSFRKTKEIAQDAFKQASIDMDTLIASISIITFPPPAQWEYEVKGLITSQATLGIEQLVSLEDSATKLLRVNALLEDANCVVGASVSYAEMPSCPRRILLCMFGTAILRKDLPEQKPLEKFTSLKKHKNLLVAHFNLGELDDVI
jgi:hypothetical protein